MAVVSVSRRRPPFVVLDDYEEPTPPSLRSRRSYSSSETRPHPAACDPDSESGAASSAATARSAAKARPEPPTASPSSTPSELDDRCRRTSLPQSGSLFHEEGPLVKRTAMASTGCGLAVSMVERCSFLHCTLLWVMSFVGACSGSAIHLRTVRRSKGPWRLPEQRDGY